MAPYVLRYTWATKLNRLEHFQCMGSWRSAIKRLWQHGLCTLTRTSFYKTGVLSQPPVQDEQQAVVIWLCAQFGQAEVSSVLYLDFQHFCADVSVCVGAEVTILATSKA